ncbi:citrate transporter [bacterium (Candidatus Blackallbacteria) CG17_big_fil_post_rev_8_21_14_2_50_48_46]|uniref:Citrate transporter n=1 Tax=bacterium (Candidatus Blackallbacteria) CG17_big_fil_post_rev_8_21_14_2_50_48_46 TaxID=2014261 RepID=A0A2M7G8T1_9BACT|nr:MAG: citrate transporter [bacterium (Candidatus Blackallbacteria) CG18_big_fil_WC_8_21_14_2_50_49_26]PIW18251.1 MAG: citrate transporter [bacterium (Candidatus Blackallbacteria) CG17_big_fil_post_rev_8_21_14_2_50_48_46]PIW50682.1 MAG: citrate transporter [bacterium (Candidatus Blackallbacteria) CG13_big_fil_rev_8_21_14_2_50_49_14]
MQTLQIILIFLSFAGMTLLMVTRLMPALLALPLLAVLLALAGGVPLPYVLEYVVGAGPAKLSGAYVVAMFGGMLGAILQKTGVAENFIKKGAELSGDNPWLISVTMLSLIILLFTTLGGLGAIIMVATIVLPVLVSVGVGPLTTVGIFLLGISIGGTLNVGNWALYTGAMGLKPEQVRPFALIMFAIVFSISLLYITLQLWRDGHDLNWKKLARNSLLVLGCGAGGTVFWGMGMSEASRALVMQGLGYCMLGLKWVVGILLLALLGLVINRAIHGLNKRGEVHWSAFFSPILPLVLILLYNVNFVAAFVIGLLYAFASTWRKGHLNVLIQSCLEGAGMVMPAVILMFGIGMILIAIMGPGGDLPKEVFPNGWPVLSLIQPLVKAVIPTHPLAYVLLFTLMAPLALYRGPLNLWGMGFGLATVFLASGLPPAAVMGLLMSVGQVQGISDPTNTQNVWLANEMRVDVQKVLWNTLPYAWGAASLGLMAAALLYLRG